MTPYIATVNIWEREIDSKLHKYNFIIYAENYTRAVAKVAEYCGDGDISSLTITAVVEPGTLISVSSATAATILETDGWYTDEL